MKKFLILFLFSLFFVIPSHASAAKSPTPKITQVVGINTPEVRVHFQLNPIKSGEMIKVKYNLRTSKFNDVKYKIPKKARRSGTVGAATSSTGSAIDLHNMPLNLEKFIYEVKVKVRVQGKGWSQWSNGFSF